MEDVFNGVGVRVLLKEPDDFLKCKETLTRIGVASKHQKVLYQSCHILHKRGQYAILHFKELFKLDGKATDISENDLARRNTIARMLAEWGLLELVDKEKSAALVVPVSQIKILSFKEKQNWLLEPKYTIGTKKAKISE